MANYTWTSTSGGSWGDAANWSGDTVPTLDDTVQIAVPGITVTVDNGLLAQAYSLTDSYSAFTIGNVGGAGSGTLQTVSSASFGGTFTEYAGGVFEAGGSGVTFGGGVDFVGGTIDLLAGATAALNDGGLLAGTFSGGGTLLLGGGFTVLATGFTDTLSSLIVGGNAAQLSFGINFSTHGNFTELANSVIDLSGHTLTLAGNTVIDGVLGGGAVVQTGGTIGLGTPNVLTVLDNGLLMTVKSTVDQGGAISLGASDGGAKVTIVKTGQYNIDGNYNIYDPSTTGSLVNLGVFTKAAGGRTAEVFTSFTSAGKIQVNIGMLLLDGLVNSIGGTVSGMGTLGIAGGQTTFGPKLSLHMAALDQQSGLLIVNKSMSFGGEWDMTGGVLNLNSSTETLTLTGQVNLDGGLVTGYGGTLDIDNAQIGGAAQPLTIGNPITLTISGVLDQTSSINFGLASNPVANIEKGATWLIEGDSQINGPFGLINNAGSFVDPNGSGTAVLQESFHSTGTVTVNNSTLELWGNSALSGTITGSGTLDLFSSNNAPFEAFYTFGSGIGISVAGLNVDGNAGVEFVANTAYANAFSQSGASSDLYVGATGAGTLKLTGTVSLDAGSLATGTITSAGATTIGAYNIDAGATLSATGNVDETGALGLSGELLINGGAVYTLADDQTISAAPNSNAGTIQDNGTFLVAGTNNSTISVVFQQAGSLVVDSAGLQLADGGMLSGSVSGAGTVQLTAGTFTLAGVNLTVASIETYNHANIALASNESYGGYFDCNTAGMLVLNSHTLSLTGTTQLVNTTLSGPGSVAVSSSATLNSITIASASLITSGAAEQLGTITLMAGNLTIQAGSYALEAGATITGTGTATVAANATLTAAGDGLAVISSNIADAGVISAALGTLAIAASVSGSGSFSIGGAGAFLDFTNTGTITGSTIIGFTAASGDLIINDDTSFAAVIAGFNTGDIIELANFSSSGIAGSLSTNGLKYTVTDGNHDSLVVTFATAQTAANLFFGTAADGNVALLHH